MRVGLRGLWMWLGAKGQPASNAKKDAFRLERLCSLLPTHLSRHPKTGSSRFGRCLPPLFCRPRGAVGQREGRLKNLSSLGITWQKRTDVHINSSFPCASPTAHIFKVEPFDGSRSADSRAFPDRDKPVSFFSINVYYLAN